ncbi:lysophospholipid acyltransferase family protein [Thioalkalivibrio sp. ALE16]|uniref:lysophospholipid acyltransferase family protein n=1 Tax=Thioalkalivibrio sp. ALE16 TaxID=1158172 RepID=UPI0009DBB2B6|nr:lysophospholipid acyltransferase family protein [Thioalkalivibrio sp. ALE16]
MDADKSHVLDLRPDESDAEWGRRPRWCRALLRLCRVEVEYRTETVRKLKAPGPLVVTCNHQSYIDGPIIALASPVPMLYAVDPVFARDNPWTSRALGALAAAGLGSVIPVSNESPTGVRHLLRALRAGGKVMIFPEGGISENGVPKSGAPGVEWLKARSGARECAIQIEGAHRSRVFGKRGESWRPRVRLRF